MSRQKCFREQRVGLINYFATYLVGLTTLVVSSHNNNHFFLTPRFPQNFGYNWLYPTSASPLAMHDFPAATFQQHQPSTDGFNSHKAKAFFNEINQSNQQSQIPSPAKNDAQPPVKTTAVDDRWSCNPNWVRRARKCYQIFASKSTWKKALDNCSNHGGLLALIDSRETQQFLGQILVKKIESLQDDSIFAWIGASRLSSNGYEWIMDKTTQDNYKHGFYSSGVRAPEKFNPRSINLLEWARNEPSKAADGCGTLAAYNKRNANYFYFREFDGKAFDLPCNNIAQQASQPPFAQAAWAICEMPATSAAAASSGSQPRVQGDIVFPNIYSDYMQAPVKESLIVNDWLVPNNYWVGGVVPYDFDKTFSSQVERNIIEKQLRLLEQDANGCVTFRLRTPADLDYLKFVRTIDASCAAKGIGRRGGMQEIFIGPVCLSPDGLPYVKHEILHALGMPHEHQRPDRDNFITVIEENIIVPARSQFFLLNVSIAIWEKFPYDFESLMHYPDNAFSFSPSNLLSIETKIRANSVLLKEANRKVSKIDKQKLNDMYCNQVIEPTGFNNVPQRPPTVQQKPSAASNNLMLLCMLQFWSFGKAELPARVAVPDTPPTLCTHIVFFSARLVGDKIAFATGQGWNAEDAGAHFPKVLQLRKQNPKLKVILVVQLEAERGGGGGGGGGKHKKSGKWGGRQGGKRRVVNDATLSTSASSPPTSESLVDKIIAFCRLNQADGVMMAERREIDAEELPQSVEQRLPQSPVLAILQKLRNGIDAEARRSGKPALSLMTSIPAPTLRTAADVITNEDAATINQNADFVWLRPNRGGPKLQKDAATGLEVLPGVESNTLAAVEGGIAQGITPRKIIMSIETSWKSYILDDENNWQPATGGGGLVTEDAYEWKLSTQKRGKDGTVGRVSQTELCLDMQRNAWTHAATLPDASAEPYAARGSLWVKYDLPASVANKVQYARERGLAGVAMTSLAYDDPHGYCGKRFPLTRAAHEALALGHAKDVDFAGAVSRRCLSFGGGGGRASSSNCELEMTCGYFPRTSFSDKEVDCAGLTKGAEQSCTAPNQGDCFLNAAARKAVAQRGGSLDGAQVTVGVAGSKADSTVTLNCNQYSPFKIGHTRYYFYCSHNFLNESSVNVYDCPDGSEFKYRRFACLAD